MLFLILFRGWYHYQIFTQYDEQSLSPPSNTPIFQESPSWTCSPPPPPASCPGPATRPGLQWPYECCLSDTRIFNFWSSTQIQAKSDQDRYICCIWPWFPHFLIYLIFRFWNLWRAWNQWQGLLHHLWSLLQCRVAGAKAEPEQGALGWGEGAGGTRASPRYTGVFSCEASLNNLKNDWLTDSLTDGPLASLTYFDLIWPISTNWINPYQPILTRINPYQPVSTRINWNQSESPKSTRINLKGVP